MKTRFKIFLFAILFGLTGFHNDTTRDGKLSSACTYSDYLSYPQFKANLHCHTLHSDGSQYPEELVSWYIEHGYQVLAISDHDAYGDQDGGIPAGFQNDEVVHDWNGDGVIHDAAVYQSGLEAYCRDYSKASPAWVPQNWKLEKPGEFIILNAVEYSFGHPHSNAIGHPEGKIARPRESYNFVETTHKNGGIVFLNHKAEWNKTPQKVYDHPDMKLYDGLEVMNGFLSRDNRDGSNKDGSPGFAEGLWDGCLNAGLQFWGFANDDAHNLGGGEEEFAGAGSAWNMIWAKDLSRQSVMDALKAGAFYASCGITIDRVKISNNSISVHSPNATHIKVIGDGNRTLKEVNASEINYTLKGDEKWIRLVLWNDLICYPDKGPQFTRKAWMQPIFID